VTIIVTGAAGFIGANIVKALNERSERDILAVDHLAQADKFHNLADCDVADYLDKHDFLDALKRRIPPYADVVFHQGACSDTMATDGRYVIENNYRFSVELFRWCQERKVPLIYASSASVYGRGPDFVEDRAYEQPLNIYGYSKFLFDAFVRRELNYLAAPVVGLRYFNVYGPRESHKGRMASVAFHAFNQLREKGHVRLFEASHGYENGEQRRDFVHVDDVVDVNLHFWKHPTSGIFNVGTGRAQSFNDVAVAVINTFRVSQGDPARDLKQLVAEGAIEYISIPDALVSKYQAFTQADLTQLRAAGCNAAFQTVESGTASYVNWLLARHPVA
jgi:ADP-L-glycero-D-manno-heptose 6-epimerase